MNKETRKMLKAIVHIKAVVLVSRSFGAKLCKTETETHVKPNFEFAYKLIPSSKHFFLYL